MVAGSAGSLRLGLDLGGNHVKVALGTGWGAELEWSDSVPTDTASGRDGVVDALRAATDLGFRFAADSGRRVEAIGLGTPGVVDTDGRVLYPIANLPGLEGFRFGEVFDRYDVPVAIENDGNVAALAEARFGAGRGAQSVVVATVGTGIGGGAVIGGELYRGASGAALEIGHIPWFRPSGEEAPSGLDAHPTPRRCGCGRWSCLETVAGGRGMLARWKDRGASGVSDATLRDLIERGNDGDTDARAILDDAADALGQGLSGVLSILDPDCLILGGGVIDGVPGFAERVERTLREWALPKSLARLTIATAEFGNRAGVLGALSLAAQFVRPPDPPRAWFADSPH